MDPPIARSPSPEEDESSPDADASALWWALSDDPAISARLAAECEGLRALRRRAIAAERAAKAKEAELGEKVTSAASALLPPLPRARLSCSPIPSSSASSSSSVPSSSTSSTFSSASSSSGSTRPSTPDDEKRARKLELQAAIDARAEARRIRKREKQRARETGTLLELKLRDAAAAASAVTAAQSHSPTLWSMHIATEMEMDTETDKETSGESRDREGVFALKGAHSVSQLVAGMTLRRRETARPLAGRRAHSGPGARVRPYVPSALYSCVSAADVVRHPIVGRIVEAYEGQDA